MTGAAPRSTFRPVPKQSGVSLNWRPRSTRSQIPIADRPICSLTPVRRATASVPCPRNATSTASPLLDEATSAIDVEREHAILERYGRCSSNVFCRSRKKSCSSGGCFKKSLPWHANRHWLVCLLNELYVLQDIGTQTVSVRTS